MYCSPACKFWIYLWYKSESDYNAICEQPDRKGQGLPAGQLCRVSNPINRDNPYKPQPPHEWDDDADAVQSSIEQDFDDWEREQEVS
jgi:hypothetical protein